MAPVEVMKNLEWYQMPLLNLKPRNLIKDYIYGTKWQILAQQCLKQIFTCTYKFAESVDEYGDIW